MWYRTEERKMSINTQHHIMLCYWAMGKITYYAPKGLAESGEVSKLSGMKEMSMLCKAAVIGLLSWTKSPYGTACFQFNLYFFLS